MGEELHLTGDPETDAALFSRERAEEELNRAQKELSEAETHRFVWEMEEEYIESLKIRINNLKIQYNVFNECYKKRLLSFLSRS